MGPKIEAICQFVELTGYAGAIGKLADAAQIIAGQAGTIITPSGKYDAPQEAVATAKSLAGNRVQR